MLYKIISVAMRILGNSAYMIISGAFLKFKVIFFLTGIRLMITNLENDRKIVSRQQLLSLKMEEMKNPD